MKRRDFVTMVGASVIAAPFVGVTSRAFASDSFEGHKFPELGFKYDALEPYIDAQTMQLHYEKHFRGYYDKFMAAAKNTDAINLPMPEIFASINKYGAAIRNDGGGYYNHSLFWENLTPKQGAIPAALNKALEDNFGSVDNFKNSFGSTAKTVFGSGWAWLAADSNGKLFITSTPNQDSTLMEFISKKGTPLLGLDVWEHAYYLHYQNRRAEYVDNFWHVVNWDTVNSRLQKLRT